MPYHARRLGVVIAISALAVLAISACAAPGDDGRVAAGPSAAPSDLVSSGPLSPGADGSVEPTPQLATPVAAEDARRQRWTSVEPVAGTSDVLVHATLTAGPPCAVLARVDAVETDKQVVITVWVGKLPDAKCDGPQPQVALPIVTKVHLQAPVGSRQLRDGAS